MIITDVDKMIDVAEVGGKAYGLSRLVKYGCEVPPFFVITADTDIKSAAFVGQLTAAVRLLNADSFAVRSSSTVEDSANNSFAGQFFTFLNVTANGILGAIEKVRTSASGADGYKNAKGAATGNMAVVVQRQLNPQSSGVMLTASPIEYGNVLIESVSGVGESLVGGSCTPLKISVSPDEICTLTGFYGELVETGKRLETLAGMPLDIEWAYDGGKLYFLQMRPITAISDNLPDMSERDWQFYVCHDFCTLCNSLQARAADGKLQNKIFGFSLPIFEGCVVNGNEFYTALNDEKQNAVWDKLDVDGFLIKYIKDIKRVISAARRHIKKVISTDYSTYAETQLFAAYRRGIDIYLKTYIPMMMRPDGYLEQKIIAITGREEYEKIMSALTSVHRRGYYADEKMKFLSAVIAGDFSSYLREYEWTDNPLGRYSQRVSVSDVAERATNISVEEARQRITKINSTRRKFRLRAKKMLGKIPDGQLKSLVSTLNEFVYLRSFVAENSDRFFYYFRNKIVDEIASRYSLGNEIYLMNYREIADLQRGRYVLAEQLKRRKSGEMTLYLDGKTEVYFGQDTYKLLRRLKNCGQVENSHKIYKGDIVCFGQTEGRVRIVNNLKQAKEAQNGEIIVTSMTTPNIVAALERAGGIITDEGGVTCHAAIIAREYGVPCLVGTKVATQVLKNGMCVSLNCIEGYFSIM